MSKLLESLGENAPTDKVIATVLAGAIVLLIQTLARVFEYDIPLDESTISLIGLGAMLVVGWAKKENRPAPSAVIEVGRQLEEWAAAVEDSETEGHRP